MEEKFVDFLSYAHFDNSHDDGLITSLGSKLANEIKAQTGVDFRLFIDRNDISWGEAWESVIQNSLRSTSFFFPVLTPSYFNSEYCVKEAKYMMNVQKREKKKSIVYPIYYIDFDKSNDNKQLKNELLKRQYFDWRDVRFEPIISPHIRKKISTAVNDITAHITGNTTKTINFLESVEVDESDLLDEAIPPSPNVETSFPNSSLPIIVAPELKGDISRIIQNAHSGAKILVHPGKYHCSNPISIDKPIELIGAGENPKDVVISSYSSVLQLNSNLARVSNITFLQNCQSNILSSGGSSDRKWKFPAVMISHGRPEISNCIIESATSNGIDVSRASPIIRNCIVRYCKGGGICFSSASSGIVEDCDLYKNELANIFIREQSNPLIRGNGIHNGFQSGVYVYDGGQGIIEDNDIYDNQHAGIATSHKGNPVARSNRITRSMSYGGVYVFKEGMGTFLENDLRGNFKGAIQTTEKCKNNIVTSGNLTGVNR